MPADRVHNLIPFVPVGDVARSIAFYELLGFAVEDTYVHAGELDFAALTSARAQIMLVRAGGAVDGSAQPLRFYLYAEDLDGLRQHLVAEGVDAGEIVDGSPGPDREMTVRDPDGYCLMVAETGVEGGRAAEVSR